MATKTVVRLAMKQLVSLVKYLEGHKAEFQRDRPEWGEVAERAARDLGFPLGAYHIKKTSKLANAEWRPKRIDSGRSYSSTWQLLASGICDIADALGIKVDPRIGEIANGRGQSENNGHA